MIRYRLLSIWGYKPEVIITEFLRGWTIPAKQSLLEPLLGATKLRQPRGTVRTLRQMMLNCCVTIKGGNKLIICERWRKTTVHECASTNSKKTGFVWINAMMPPISQ
jgi:hypothetical protein